MTRFASVLVSLTFACVVAVPEAIAGPPRAGDRGDARQLLVKYFDAIQHDDKPTACRLYRIPGCSGRKPFGLDAYDLAGFEHVGPEAGGDWGGLVYLYAPRRSDGTRDVAIALAVVTCRRNCKITRFWGITR